MRHFTTFFIATLLVPQVVVSQLSQQDNLRSLLVSRTDSLQISAALKLADHFILRGQEDSISKYVQLSEQLVPKVDSFWKARLLTTKGRNEYQHERYEEAKVLLHEALALCQQNSDYSTQVDILNLFGNIHFSSSRYEKSLENYLNALQLVESESLVYPLGPLYNNVSAVLFQMGKKEESFTYKSQAMEAHEKEGSTVGAIITGYNLCSQYNAENQYDSAELYCTRALLLADSIAMKEGILRVKNKLANVLLNKMQLDQTIQLCLEVLEENPSTFHKQYSYLNLAQAYKEKGQFQKAITYSTKCFELSQGMSDLSGLASVLELQYDLHKAVGNFEIALTFHEEFKAVQDSFLTQSNFEKVTELQEKYEVVKREKEIESLSQMTTLQAVKLSQKNTLIASIIIVALVLSIAIFIYSKHHIENEKRKSNEMKQRLLRSQMNPHFLFNALGAIQQFIYQKKNAIETGDYLGRFSQLTRMILNHTQQDFISLEEEITFLETYLELQKLRFDTPFEYNIVLSEKLEPEEILIPPMFTQPFIENSIEHGILKKQEKGKIEIYFNGKGEQLEIVLQDNGIGRKKASFEKRNEKHRSLATQLTFDRLRVMQKDFRRKTAMVINDLFDSEKNVTGTQVIFNLPLIYNH